MVAARAFAEKAGRLPAANGTRLRVELFGSLALTGRGHLTDLAVAAGLAGYGPRDLAEKSLSDVARDVRGAGHINVGGRRIAVDMDRDLVFDAVPRDLPHPNTMRFSVLAASGETRLSETYYSIGGGRLAGGDFGPLPSRGHGPQTSAASVLEECRRLGIDLVEHVYRAEERDHAHSRAAVDEHVAEMWAMMQRAIDRGLAASGTLPGSLKLERRAKSLYARFLEQLPHFHILSPEASLASIYAIAAAEENAAGGVVVTAPTCGSCGVLPACLRIVQAKRGFSNAEIQRALLVAGFVGEIIAANASISGAEVGCQGEIGAASAMAAGARSTTTR